MSALKTHERPEVRPPAHNTTKARGSVSRSVRRDLVFAVVVLAVGVIAILPGREGVGTSISTMQLVASMAAMVVAAVGLNLLVGYTKLVSLGQGAFYAIGAYASAWFTLDVGLHPVLAILAALALCGVVGAVVAVASMRLRGPQFSVITLVLAVLVERILNESAALGRLAGYPNTGQHGTSTMDPISIFGLTLRPPMIANEVGTVMVPIIVITALVLILNRNLVKSPWGHSLSAIGESEMLASHLGVNVFSRKVTVFVVASVLGGLGGVIAVQTFAHLQPETFDIFLTITIVLAVVFGGSGTVLGPVVGAVAIVWLEQSAILQDVSDFQRDNISDSWYLSTPGLVGVLFILTLFLMPRGIVGSLEAVLARRSNKAMAKAVDDQHGGLADVDTDELEGTGVVPATGAVPARDEEGPGRTLLRIEGMSKNFGALKAVDGMDLEVQAGRIHAIIGPNGAGKSTLANLLTGVYKPTEGKVTFREEDLTGLAPHKVARAGIARTFQTPQLFRDATVRENVMAGFPDTGRLSLWKAAIKPPSRYRREAEMASEAQHLLKLVGLEDVAEVRASELPYGKQRALEIARALASKPELIVLDEPAAGLLATESVALGDLLMALRNQGYGLVVVEHHMDLVMRLADRVTCMDQGRLLARGTAREVLSDEAVIAAYLGKPMDLENGEHA